MSVQYGQSGGDIYEVQRLLNGFGYHLTVDGIFGQGTYDAVIGFQSHHGLTADGIVGSGTWAKLHGNEPPHHEPHPPENAPDYEGETQVIYIEEGQLAYQIARDYGISVGTLHKLNPQIADMNRIYVGQEMTVPYYG